MRSGSRIGKDTYDMKKFIWMVTSLTAAVLLMSACTVAPVASEETAAASAATEAPAAAATDEPVATAEPQEGEALSFSLTTLTGGTLDQTIFSDNKLVMVNYWATWCGPCVGEIPDLVTISKDYANKGFAIVGVLTGDDDTEGAKQFIADQGVNYPVVLPEEFFGDNAAGIYAIPTTMFFDSEGNQVGETVVGAKSYEDWSGLIDLLLGQVS